jgi:hypothetical protein
MKIAHDSEIRTTMQKILRDYPEITNADVPISDVRDSLISDICALIARLPMTEVQGKALYDAVTGRYQHRTCFKCLKLKCILNGSYIYPGGNLGGQKRFICGECK